jgi:hypothetical protein
VSWLERRAGATIADAPESGSLEARASLVFKAMGVIGFVGIVLSLIPDSFPNSALQTFSFNLATGLVSALYLIEARGVDRGRAWARAAVRPMLLVLGAWGAYAALAGFNQGVLRIPFELAMGAWAFLGSRAPLPTPPLAGRSLAVIGAAAPLVGVMALGHLVFGWGGVLDVKQPDLVATLSVDCGDQAAGPPEQIAVEYAWSWSRAAPLPNEVDTVFVGWDGDDAEGSPLYIFSDNPNQDPTIRSGQRGVLGIALLEEARGTTPGFQWAVDLYQRGYQPGRLAVTLRLARPEASGPLSLTVRASYIHLNVWSAEPPAVTCTW